MPYTASGAAMLNNMTDDLSSSCTGGCNVISAFCPTCPAWVLGNISETLMSGGPSGPFDVNIAGTVYSLTSASGNTDATAHWNDAMYANLGGKVGGEWLKIWIVISITIACVGMYEADLSAGAYQLLGMAERGMIPSIFAKRSHFGTPTWGIVLASCVAWLCVIFDLESLIEMLNISYVLAAVLEIAAFLHLRYYRFGFLNKTPRAHSHRHLTTRSWPSPHKRGGSPIEIYAVSGLAGHLPSIAC